MGEPTFHSTGRGGAGNIGPGEGVYVAGDIVREGPEGGSLAGGRGGAGNFPPGNGQPPHQHANPEHQQHQQQQHQQQHQPPQSQHPHPQGRPPMSRGSSNPNAARSHDIVPEPAMRSAAGYEDFHTGRGGEGNVHRDKYGGHSGPQRGGKHETLLDRAKHAVGLDGKSGR